MPPKRAGASVEDVAKRLTEAEQAISNLQQQVTRLEEWKVKMKEKKRERKEHKDKKDKKDKKDLSPPKAKNGRKREKPEEKAASDSTPPPPAKRGRGRGRSAKPMPALPSTVGTAAAGAPRDLEQEMVDQHALAVQTKQGRGRGGRRKASPAPKEPQAAASAAADVAAGKDETKKVKVTDPRAQLCCYELLRIPRTATPDQVKRAFRSLAVSMHPDKGGDHKEFCCLQEAFETLQDKADRAAYDRELVRLGSRDGLSTSSSSLATGQDQKTSASPVMLRDYFLAVPASTWEEALGVLSDANVKVLKDFLDLSKEEQSRAAKQKAPSLVPGRSAANTPGICRAGQSYYAKMAFESLSIMTRTTHDLAVAIDARIALLSLRATLKEHIEQGSSFDDAVRAAVALHRSQDQNDIFYVKYTYDFGRPPTRFMTPTVMDVEVLLEDRRTFLEMQERGAKKSEFGDAHTSMQMRSNSQRREILSMLSQNRQELVAQVARAWQRRQNGLAWQLQLKPKLAIANKAAADELGSDPESSSSSSSSSSEDEGEK
eukprot:TRINITY_DN3815_c0_g1_i1.p1 TRINITY_DN3815_c0_g1~~TRINITY_DN3815_c0_g1_i1.p1  ORF type:complete len:544 (-),score=132.58 TRINITY_DN3815_c0_g1_i1:94-1725(-)